MMKTLKSGADVSDDQPTGTKRQRANAGIFSQVQRGWAPVWNEEETFVHMSLPICVLERIMAVSSVFKKLGIVFKPERMVSVFTEGGYLINCWKLEKDLIQKKGYIYFCDDTTKSKKFDIGFDPEFVHKILTNNVPSDVIRVELALLKKNTDALMMRVGSWIHEIPLFGLPKFRCHRPDDALLKPECIVEVRPKEFCGHIRICAKIPVARREQVMLGFTENGIQIKTVSGKTDIRQESYTFLAWANGNEDGVSVADDRSTIINIPKFEKNVEQVFDMTMLSTILKQVSALSPHKIVIQAQENEPLLIKIDADEFGTGRFYISAKVDLI
jgi:hypothetical protein